MIRVLFVCHGNICRSTMAEYVMKDLTAKAGLSDSFHIDSAATSREERLRRHQPRGDRQSGPSRHAPEVKRSGHPLRGSPGAPDAPGRI